MENLKSILAVVERDQQGQHALRKALVLARHSGARIELFLCEPSTGSGRSRLEEGRAYLEALRNSVVAEDIQIALDIACESPVYAGVVRKITASRPDLVIKQIGDGLPAALTGTDSHLIDACPTPLLLTRGRPWNPQPRFVALVDVSQESSSILQRSIAHAGEYLALTCRAEFELVYNDVMAPTMEQTENTETAPILAVRRLAQEFKVSEERTHILRGRPDATLVEFLTERRCDLVLLGATQKRTFTARVGKLTQRLLAAFDCDFVVVK